MDSPEVIIGIVAIALELLAILVLAIWFAAKIQITLKAVEKIVERHDDEIDDHDTRITVLEAGKIAS